MGIEKQPYSILYTQSYNIKGIEIVQSDFFQGLTIKICIKK